MQCKACGNEKFFTEYEHKYYSVEYTPDGRMARKDKVPYQWKIQTFCAICKQLVLESQ